LSASLSSLSFSFSWQGGNVILGPGINVHRVARGGRNVEYMSGEEPFLGRTFAAPYVKGLQDKGILTVTKCFMVFSKT
jgi:beta-glucosidase